ncbi:ParB/RepB/Spo0J family partition protein [Nocardia alni]|uniref:ParB/RepB/Spo0J family partition protein n=1 Tax=Nocardia alni TaxID=2815723 RepID=UPI001C234E77|nr:ParB N-terminal domain-containing protein [Nocardia alni]
MTTTIDTPHTTPDPDSGAHDSGADRDYPQPEAKYLDPKTLVLDDNVRENFTLSDFPDVIASIKENGVKIAIKAYRESDGRIMVIEGQLRLLIALEAGCTRVPVWIEPAPDVTAKQRAVARITEQINANDHRVALTEGDRAGGIAELLDLGVSLTRISKSLTINNLDTVRKSGQVGHSRTARTMLDDNQLILDHAAILAEFDAIGDTAAVQQLQRAHRTTFVHEAYQIRQERQEDRDRLTASLPYAAAGFAVAIMEPETFGQDAPYLPAKDLVTSDGQEITPELLRGNPDGWVVYVTPGPDQILVDRDTGEVVDPDTIDPATKDQPGAEPGEGLRHADSVEHRAVWAPNYYLPTDLLDTSGYRLAPVPEPEPAEVQSDSPVTDSESIGKEGPLVDGPPLAVSASESTPVRDEVSEAQRQAELAEQRALAEQRQAEREAAAREAKRLQDRHDALTKRFTAATSARLDFVRTFAERASAPTSAQRFLLEATGVHALSLDSYQPTHTALQWLRIQGSRPSLAEAAVKARPGRCTVMLLTIVFAAYEARITKDEWAHHDPRTSAYLHFLAELGYDLAAVEQAAAGDLDPATLDPDA